MLLLLLLLLLPPLLPPLHLLLCPAGLGDRVGLTARCTTCSAAQHCLLEQSLTWIYLPHPGPLLRRCDYPRLVDVAENFYGQLSCPQTPVTPPSNPSGCPLLIGSDIRPFFGNWGLPKVCNSSGLYR